MVREYYYIYERVLQLLEELGEKFKKMHWGDDLESEERLESLEEEAEVLRKVIKSIERLLSMMKSELDEGMYSVVAYNVIYGLWIWLNQLLTEIEMMIRDLKIDLEGVEEIW
jgi:hypothetical protein